LNHDEPLFILVNYAMLSFMPVKIVNQLIDSERYEIGSTSSPFLSYDFFQTLEESKSIGKGTGWNPIYITDPGKSSLHTFIKEHSYGEYIFDWDWASFYQKYNVPYYPKLTSMIPFTSVTATHFLGESSKVVMESYEQFYDANDLSSSHFLFIPESDLEFFKSFNYIIRDSFQYHFKNNSYDCFDDFLSDLKSKKAKQIRKERVFSSEIKINKFTRDELTAEHAEQMYSFYQSTIDNKQAYAYLTKDFFIKIFNRLKNNIYYVHATRDDKPIAGSIYFYDSDRLYGRYWGATEHVPNLHFELCFYQGIEFCIEKKLSVFEAGAQGEHKISRGFRPVKTYSAHKFKHPQFSEAIEKYIRDEREQIETLISKLSDRLPFKDIALNNI
jgi:predicted N-acyltransferase